VDCFKPQWAIGETAITNFSNGFLNPSGIEWVVGLPEIFLATLN